MGNIMRNAVLAVAICGLLGPAALSKADTYYWVGQAGEGVATRTDWSNNGGLANPGFNWGDAGGNYKVGVPGEGDTVVFGNFGFPNGAPSSDTDRVINDLVLNLDTNSGFYSFDVLLLQSGSITYRESAAQNSFEIDAPLQLANRGVWDVQGRQTETRPYDLPILSTLTGRGFTKRGTGSVLLANRESGIDAQLLNGEVIRVEDGTVLVGGGFSSGIAVADFVVGGGTPVGSQVLQPKLVLEMRSDRTASTSSGGTYQVLRGGVMEVSILSNDDPVDRFKVGQVSLEGGTLRLQDKLGDFVPYYFDGITASADVDETFPAFPQFTASTLSSNPRGEPIRIGDAAGTLRLVNPAGYDDTLSLVTDAPLSAGILTVTGGGSMRLTGSKDNFVDTFAVQGATVFSGRDAFTDVFGLDLQIGGVSTPSVVVLEKAHQLRDAGAPKIFGNGSLVLQVDENVGDLTLGEGGEVTGTGALSATSVRTLAGGGTISTPFELSNVTNEFNVVSDATLLMSGRLLGSLRTLTKSGEGTLRITNGGDYSGSTFLNSGTLDLSGDLSQSRVQFAEGTTLRSDGGTVGSLLGSSTSDIVLGNGGLTITGALPSSFEGSISSESGTTGGITLQSGGLGLTGPLSYRGRTVVNAGASLAFNGTGIANSSGVTANGTFDISNAQNATVTLQSLTGGGLVRLGDKTLNLNRTSGTETFSGNFSGTNTIIKRGAARTNLTGNSSFSGQVELREGVLGISRSGALGIDDPTNRLLLSGGTLALLDDVAMFRPVVLQSNSAPANGSIDLGNHSMFLLGPVSSSPGSFGGLSVTGDGGTLSLSNTANTYTGPTRVSGGATLLVNGAGSLGSVTNPLRLDDATFGSNARNTTIFNPITVDAGNATFNAFGSTLSLANVIGGPGRVTIDDAIGNGSVRFTNANTYQGDTVIAGGTLVVANTTGSATGSGTVFIEGGTLAGTGRIASNSSVFLSDGVIRPGDDAGNGIGTLTISLPDAAGFVGLLGFGGGTLEFDLGTQSDLIRFTSLSTALAGDQTVLNLSLTAGFSYAQTYTLFANVLDSGSSFAFADITGLDAGYDATVFHNADLSAYQIRFAAVPEPTTAALISLGMLSLARRRRV